MSAQAPLLQLPAGRAVWTVAWPMVALGWVRSLYLVADAWWVGWLGSDALTALSAAAFGWWILDHLGELAATGVHSGVAQEEGAGRGRPVDWLAGGLVVAMTVLLPVAATASWWAPHYADALALGEGTVREGTLDYLVAAAWVAPGVAAQAVLGGVFRGLGETRTALGITTAGLVLNLLLDPLAIWGLGPVPGLGIAGAAWATGLSGLCGAVLGLLALRWRGRMLRPEPLRVERLVRIGRVGAPISVTGVGFALVYVVLGRIISELGDPHLAALGVGHRLESFPYLAAVGFGVGAATLVGQRVGAGDAPGAREAARAAVRACTVAMLACAVVGWLGAEPLYRAYTHDPAIVASGVVYLRWQAAVWVWMGWELVCEGAFTGAGRTTPAMLLGGGLTLARIPLAWTLAHVAGFGIAGVWAAVALSTAAKGLALAAWWRWGGSVETATSKVAARGANA